MKINATLVSIRDYFQTHWKYCHNHILLNISACLQHTHNVMFKYVFKLLKQKLYEPWTECKTNGGCEWSHPPALTCNSIFLCGHSMCIQLLELPVELLQFSAGGSKLTVHISSILAVGHRSSQPLSRLFDLQFPLNLLPEKGDRILYTLLELRVHEVTFSQTPQTAALLCSSNIEKVQKSTCIKLLFAYSSLFD